jgi:hypothetical protein
MVVSVGLRHYKAETHGFAYKRHFAQIASLKGIDSLDLRSLLDRAPLARRNASARSVLECVHVLRWSLGKRKGASRKACAKLDLYFQPSKSGGVNPPSFQIYFCR